MVNSSSIYLHRVTAYKFAQYHPLVQKQRTDVYWPVGVVETWQRMMAKCVLKVVGQEAEEACRKNQICGRMDVVIERGIHAMHLLWKQNDHKEEWGFLLIDTQNEFNDKNQTEMMQDV